ncbi:LptF/LptG family permease [Pedobacter cryophilus]|uniref:YjgP/YjgQ family permease n=1 Tax=Pedobacter cryophilus TaxID=2571271 RepID=A0A4V5NXM5_9SPHI|nr:LptF/LptG family permease [Pedobacter cryophilus]TKB98753.1 YjgP/YjgQ family permease [Pedobacter cryophilus]
MKKIHLLLLRAFIRPFIVTFFIVMFLLLMLFLFKYIDDLIGKGFEWYVILQLLMYASATNVAMALPLSILLSSIMTFGNLGENYELVAIKSAGISLQRAMAPLFVLITFLGIGAFLFSDYMLPVANLKMGSLLYDVREQKAAFLIEEGIFNNSIPGYSIRVEKKLQTDSGDILRDIVIYDQSNAQGNTNVLMAREGEMSKTKDGNFLILTLRDGVRYEERQGKTGYNPRQQLTRLRFKETEQKFDLSSFQFKREDESLFKSNYQMLNLKQLVASKDSVSKLNDSITKTTFNAVKPYFKIYYQANRYKSSKTLDSLNFKKQKIFAGIRKNQKEMIVVSAKENARMVKEAVSTINVQSTDYINIIRRYLIEYNKKFTLAFSCLVLFFIGAPLGAIIRKGGLGLPVVVSVVFFLIYHIISTVGEKYVKGGNLSPVIGMWLAIFVLTPVGLFLTYKATIDSALFDVDAYKNLYKKVFNRKKKD